MGEEPEEVTNNRIYRLLFLLFVYCNDDDIIDHVLKTLKLGNVIIATFIKYEYNEKKDNDKIGFDWHSHTLIGQVIFNQSLSRLKKMESMIGIKDLIESISKIDKFGVDGLEYAMRSDKAGIVEYLLLFQEIKDKHNLNVREEDEEKEKSVKMAIFRLLYYIFIKCTNYKSVEQILSEFSFENETKAKYVGFSYPTPTKEEIERGIPRYDEINIIESASKLNKRGINSLEAAIWNKRKDVYAYLLTL